MKEFKTLQQLPKSDTETGSVQMLLGKWYQQSCLMQGCHTYSICEKCNICKAQQIEVNEK